MKTGLQSHKKIKGIVITVISVFTLSSCQKTPGQAYVPYSQRTTAATTSSTTTTAATSTTSAGTTPANTVIFKINNDTTYTWTSAKYNIQVVTVLPPVNLTHLIVTAITAVGLTNTFDLMMYNNLQVGIVKNPGFILLNNQVQYISVTSEVVNVTTQTLTYPQTVAGTFDGYMQKQSSSTPDSVRVTGSFNLTQ